MCALTRLHSSSSRLAWLLLALLTGWFPLVAGAAPPTPAAPPTASLAAVLNPDGTLRADAQGSFDARHFVMQTPPDGRPAFRLAGVAGTGDERWLSGFNLSNGVDGTVHTVVRSGTDIYIGGNFTAVGNTPANSVAKWNGTSWSPLGAGPNNGTGGIVRALAVAPSGDVYAGGQFPRAGGGYNDVVKWNGSSWTALNLRAKMYNGNEGVVFALALASNGDVYAGGTFATVNSNACQGVARWNGTTWLPLGAGVLVSDQQNDGKVYALALAGNGDLYAGGFFAEAGSQAVSNIAKWNGTSWSPLGAGTNSPVYALAMAASGELYVGGNFTQVDGTLTANNVAKWDGTSWSTLGSGLQTTTSGPTARRSAVNAMALAGNGDVYVGGYFSQAGGTPAASVARWNGTAWTALGDGVAPELTASNTGAVKALALSGSGDLYAGGEFSQAGNSAAYALARWNGTTWNNLAAVTGNGIAGTISTLAVASNGDVYVAGVFRQVGNTTVNGVAKWNGSAWSALGAGIFPAVVEQGFVGALALGNAGEVYVAYSYVHPGPSGNILTSRVDRWNGAAWSTLGTFSAGSTYVPGTDVYALAVAPNGDLYAGGNIVQVNGMAINRIAKWNGSAWSQLGSGIDFGPGTISVNALAIAPNGDVYAGGSFTSASGVAGRNVAKWNGTAWSGLGTGVNSPVYALAVTGTGEVYAGGAFTQAGGSPSAYVAKWSGTAWSSLGSGVSGKVQSLAVTGNGGVYVGGSFVQAGGAPAANVAHWNGTNWTALGTGLNGGVNALAVGTGGKVYAGGSFTAVGDNSKLSTAFGVYDPQIPLAVSPARAALAFSLYPNPAQGTAVLLLSAAAQPRVVRILDAAGREVRRQRLPAHVSTTTLELTGLAAGLYTVRLGAAACQLLVE